MLNKKLLAIYLSAFIGPFGGNTILTLIPALEKAFNVGAYSILLSIFFFMVPFAFFQLFSGTISDITDRKRIVIFGFLVYAIGSLICAFSINLRMFLAARTTQGFGYAFSSPVLVAILGDITTPKTRGKAMGFLGSAITTGIALGPLIGGLFADLNWRLTFTILFLLVLDITFLFWMTFRHYETSTATGPRNILSQMKIAALNRNVILLAISGFSGFLCFMGVISISSEMLSKMSYSPMKIAIILMSTGLPGIIISPYAGILVDKIGRKRTAILGFLIAALALLLLIYFHETFISFLLLLGILGCGTATVWASLLTISVEILPDLKGTVSSTFNSARFFGYAVAPVIFGAIFALYGVEIVYLLTSIIALLGGLFASILKTKIS